MRQESAEDKREHLMGLNGMTNHERVLRAHQINEDMLVDLFDGPWWLCNSAVVADQLIGGAVFA